MLTLKRYLAVLAIFAQACLLLACGGGSGADQDGGSKLYVKRLDGMAVMKVQTGQQGPVVLMERPGHINDPSAPNRRLAFLRGDAVVSEYAPPSGWRLLDFTTHPSGDVSVVLGADRELRLMRLSPLGNPLFAQAFADPQARNDPDDELSGRFDRESMVPAFSRDAARVARIGEDLAVAIRTGINAVVAYRFSPEGGQYRLQWRTLVEPGMGVGGRFLSSGSHDPFAQLTNHAKVLLDTNDAGQIAVGVVGGLGTQLFQAHRAQFGPLPEEAVYGAIVTQLSPSGQRLSATIVNTRQMSEAHGLKAVAGGYALVGRVKTHRLRDDGWDAYAALVSASGGLASYQVIDVDRGDVLFDIVSLGDDRYLAAGTAGYTQNPDGTSISEVSTPLLVTLGRDLRVTSRHAVDTGPRQNQLRSIAAYGASWLLGGFQNGPGTHSADASPAALTADGVIKQVSPAP